jgi:hypothetical protein
LLKENPDMSIQLKEKTETMKTRNNQKSNKRNRDDDVANTHQRNEECTHVKGGAFHTPPTIVRSIATLYSHYPRVVYIVYKTWTKLLTRYNCCDTTQYSEYLLQWAKWMGVCPSHRWGNQQKQQFMTHAAEGNLQYIDPKATKAYEVTYRAKPPASEDLKDYDGEMCTFLKMETFDKLYLALNIWHGQTDAVVLLLKAHHNYSQAKAPIRFTDKIRIHPTSRMIHTSNNYTTSTHTTIAAFITTHAQQKSGLLLSLNTPKEQWTRRDTYPSILQLFDEGKVSSMALYNTQSHFYTEPNSMEEYRSKLYQNRGIATYYYLHSDYWQELTPAIDLYKLIENAWPAAMPCIMATMIHFPDEKMEYCFIKACANSLTKIPHADKVATLAHMLTRRKAQDPEFLIRLTQLLHSPEQAGDYERKIRQHSMMKEDRPKQ